MARDRTRQPRENTKQRENTDGLRTSGPCDDDRRRRERDQRDDARSKIAYDRLPVGTRLARAHVSTANGRKRATGRMIP